MVKIIELKTTQSSAIKILVDTLNSLLTDVNITFYPTQDNVVDSEDSDDSDYNEDESSESQDGSCEKKKKTVHCARCRERLGSPGGPGLRTKE